MKVRIAMVGYGKNGMADTVDDVSTGIRMPWVELDGHRYDEVVSAKFETAKDDVSECVLVLAVIGPVELVYTDSKGEPLPGGGNPVTVEYPQNLGEVDYQTAVQREHVEAKPDAG